MVLDGTFRAAALRERAAGLADDCGAAFELVKVEFAEDVVGERIKRRERNASDAEFEVHRPLRELFDPVRTDHVAVDNSGCLDEVRQQVDAHF